MFNDDSEISPDDVIRLAIELDEEIRLQLLQAWNENKFRRVQKIFDEFN